MVQALAFLDAHYRSRREEYVFRGKDQVLTTLALIGSEQACILERHLPGCDDVAVES